MSAACKWGLRCWLCNNNVVFVVRGELSTKHRENCSVFQSSFHISDVKFTDVTQKSQSLMDCSALAPSSCAESQRREVGRVSQKVKTLAWTEWVYLWISVASRNRGSWGLNPSSALPSLQPARWKWHNHTLVISILIRFYQRTNAPSQLPKGQCWLRSQPITVHNVLNIISQLQCKKKFSICSYFCLMYVHPMPVNSTDKQVMRIQNWIWKGKGKQTMNRNQSQVQMNYCPWSKTLCAATCCAS